MAGQGNKRSAPHLPKAPPQSQPTASTWNETATQDEASTLDEASTPALACCLAPSRSSSQGEVVPGGALQWSLGKARLGQRGPRALAEVVSRIWTAAAHQAAFPTCWKVVSQSSGLRETSNTPTGLAEIFIHLHFQICSTFSLYKYMGSS